MALGYDIYKKIWQIIESGYFTDLNGALNALCDDFERAGIFGGTAKRQSYEEKLNKLILQYKSSDNIHQNKSVETFLRKMSEAGLSFDDDVLKSIQKQDSQFNPELIKNNIISQLASGWGTVREEIKFLKDEQTAQDFIEASIDYEKELRQTYSKTQKVTSIFSKYGQALEKGVPNKDVEKYYTFFFLDSTGKQLKDVISISDEYFETLLKQTAFARLNVASYNEEKRKKELGENYVLEDLKQIQNLGYGITGSQNFKKALNLEGGEHRIALGEDRYILLSELQERFNILTKANERGLIRNQDDQKIPAKRLTEMLLHDDVFEQLRAGYGYRWNTSENIAATVEGDYEQGGVSHSIKTFGAGSSSIQLMPASLEESFKNIFKNKDSFRAEIEKRTSPNNNQQVQKELNGVLDDLLTKQLNIVSKGQDFLEKDFNQIIQNNPVLQKLGITSNEIAKSPEFQQIYAQARNGSSQIDNAGIAFLKRINDNKVQFYKDTIQTYIENKRKSSGGPWATKKMEAWAHKWGYQQDVDSLNINFIPGQEVEDQVTNAVEQTIIDEGPLTFDLSLFS